MCTYIYDAGNGDSYAFIQIKTLSLSPPLSLSPSLSLSLSDAGSWQAGTPQTYISNTLATH